MAAKLRLLPKGWGAGGGGWIRDLYLIRQSTQEVPEIKAKGFLFSPVST